MTTNVERYRHLLLAQRASLLASLTSSEAGLAEPRPIDERRVDGGLMMTFHPSAGSDLRVLIVARPTRPGWRDVRLTAGASAATLHIATLP